MFAKILAFVMAAPQHVARANDNTALIPEMVSTCPARLFARAVLPLTLPPRVLVTVVSVDGV